jgi:hypothetical protein
MVSPSRTFSELTPLFYEVVAARDFAGVSAIPRLLTDSEMHTFDKRGISLSAIQGVQHVVVDASISSPRSSEIYHLQKVVRKWAWKRVINSNVTTTSTYTKVLEKLRK